jgi:hypothetical protein
MNRFSKGHEMTNAQKMLLQTLAGHFAWLESAHPRKAHRATARKAKQCVIARLRICNTRQRLAA